MAIEVDADAISDGETVVVAGIMEHIEEAGVHSGGLSLFVAALYVGQERGRERFAGK